MTRRKPRLLILLFTGLAGDARVLRQVRAFTRDFDVTTVGVGPTPFPDVTHIELPAEIPGAFLARAWRYALRRVAWRTRFYALYARLVPQARWVFQRVRREEWDVVVANDVDTVPLANRLGARYGVLVDLHEYAPRQFEHSAQWVRETAPYNTWICSAHVSRAARVVTVSEGIAEEYRRNFGFDPFVVVNATPFADLAPGPVESSIRLVHSGIAAPARRLDLMIEGLRSTDLPVTLDLYLVRPGTSEYVEELERLAAGDPRIRILPAVPYERLVATLNRYDVGVSIIAPTTFNHKWSLPNKFFDYVQARLGVIIGPSLEMSRYLERYGFGESTRGFEAGDFAEVLRDLTVAKVETWKRRAAECAEELSGEHEMARLADLATGMVASERMR